jgi:hypothetical protein
MWITPQLGQPAHLRIVLLKKFDEAVQATSILVNSAGSAGHSQTSEVVLEGRLDVVRFTHATAHL